MAYTQSNEYLSKPYILCFYSVVLNKALKPTKAKRGINLERTQMLVRDITDIITKLKDKSKE